MVDQDFFETKVNAFRVYKEDVQQAYNVFKLKGKAKVISRNFLNHTIVSDFLVQSDVMKTYLENIGLRIKSLLLEEKNDSLGFFYFAQYGGSKSQFIELLKDDLIRRGEKDSEFDSNKLIFLHFPGIVDITGNNIFNQLIEGGIRGIARGIEKDDKYSQIFSQIFGKSAEDLGMELVYDVAHNIAKVEEHVIDGKRKKVVVHRKGSTRAFPPGHPELPNLYKETGQPVIIGGSMETGSYLLAGTQKAMDDTFGSTAHGSGRTMSRSRAKREIRGDVLQKDMEKRGIYVKAASYSGLAEEARFAYKNINEVVETLKIAGISKPVVK
ncbi:MAG: RtcB family protein, partial [Thaumarchaeota archaeon]|nr:RtcB family protein [Nitrososphaerota archaeon]